MRLLNKIRYALGKRFGIGYGGFPVNDRLVVKKRQKYGVIDKNGEIVFNFEEKPLRLIGDYLRITVDSNYLFDRDNSFYSIVDLRTKNTVFKLGYMEQLFIPAECNCTKEEQETYLLTDSRENALLSGCTGKIISGITDYRRLRDTSAILIERDGKWGVVSRTLDEIIPCEYDSVSFDGKRFVTQNKEKSSLATEKRKTLNVKQEENKEETNSPKQHDNHELTSK